MSAMTKDEVLTVLRDHADGIRSVGKLATKPDLSQAMQLRADDIERVIATIESLYARAQPSASSAPEAGKIDEAMVERACAFIAERDKLRWPQDYTPSEQEDSRCDVRDVLRAALEAAGLAGGRDALSELEWRIVANAGLNSGKRQVRWAHVQEITAHGSNFSADMCRRAGFDPDEETGGDTDRDDSDDDAHPESAASIEAAGLAGGDDALLAEFTRYQRHSKLISSALTEIMGRAALPDGWNECRKWVYETAQGAFRKVGNECASPPAHPESAARQEAVAWYCAGPGGGFVVWDRDLIEAKIAAHAAEHFHEPDDYTATALYTAPQPAPAQSEGEKPIPLDKCPITGRPFFMNIEHDELGCVPTYGGPFDSYTIPALVRDGSELRSERYDHEAGRWIEGGEPVLDIFTDDAKSEWADGLRAIAAAKRAATEPSKAEQPPAATQARPSTFTAHPTDWKL